MARRCTLTDKSSQYGNNVSHAQNKSRRTFKVNVQNVSLVSEALDKVLRLKIAVNTLRSIEHNGGLDNFLVTASDRNLSDEGVKLKRKVKKALVEKGGLKKPEAKVTTRPSAKALATKKKAEAKPAKAPAKKKAAKAAE